MKPKPASVLIIARSEEAVACRCVSVILSVEGSGGQPTNRLKLQNDEDTDGRSNGLLTAAEQSKVAAVKGKLAIGFSDELGCMQSVVVRLGYN